MLPPERFRYVDGDWEEEFLTNAYWNPSDYSDDENQETQLGVENWNISFIGYNDARYYLNQWCKYENRMIDCLDLRRWKIDGSMCWFNLNFLFKGIKNVKRFDLRNWDTSLIRTMIGMFENCVELEELDLRDWDMSIVNDLSRFCAGCVKLKKVVMGKWLPPMLHVSYCELKCRVEGMFENCDSLEEVYMVGAVNKGYLNEMRKLMKMNENVRIMFDETPVFALNALREKMNWANGAKVGIVK